MKYLVFFEKYTISLNFKKEFVKLLQFIINMSKAKKKSFWLNDNKDYYIVSKILFITRNFSFISFNGTLNLKIQEIILKIKK